MKLFESILIYIESSSQLRTYALVKKYFCVEPYNSHSRISDIFKSQFGVLQGGMLSPKQFTEFLQDISALFDQDQGIAVDTLLMVSDICR